MKNIIYVIVILAISFSTSIYSKAQEDTFNILLSRAEESYKSDDYGECINIIEAAIKKYPNAKKMDYGKGGIASAYIGLKQYEKAKRLIRTLQAEYPGSERTGLWEYQLAFIEYKQGNLQTALDDLNNFINKFPSDEYVPTANYIISRIYRKLGKFDLSVKYAEKFINTSPDSPLIKDAELVIAYSLLKSGNYNKAADRYKDFIKQYKDRESIAEAYYFLGQCYDAHIVSSRIAKTKVALKYYNKVVNDFPDSKWAPSAENSIGDVYYNLGNYDQAIVHFNNCVKNSKTNRLVANSLYWLGKSYQAKGNNEKAIKLFNHVIKAFPDNMWAKRAQAELKRGNDGKNHEPGGWSHQTSAEKGVIMENVPLYIKSKLELGWRAKPTFLSEDKDLNSITSVSVLFYVKEVFARWKIGDEDFGEVNYKIKWDNGPGPFIISVDQNTGKPSQEDVTGEATIMIIKRDSEEKGETSKIIFNYNDYVSEFK